MRAADHSREFWGDVADMTNRMRRFAVSGAVILVLWVLWNIWKSLMPDYWWFKALASASDADYLAVFRTVLGTRVVFGGLMMLVMLCVSFTAGRR